MEACR
ncbi:hypothetical protein SOVF_179470, partial [Spinacia oleracea]